jgi:hypothetical protein
MRQLPLLCALGFTIASTAAFAQPISTPTQPQLAESADGPGSGVQLELGVFGASGLLNLVNGVASGGTGSTLTGLPPATPTGAVAVGYQWNQNAILLGFGVASNGGTALDNQPQILFGIGPTFRRYFAPLRTGGFSGFGEGTVALVMDAPSTGSAVFGFGADAGLGGEWLFVRNFGLFAKATLGYEHLNGFGVNIDGVGLSGDIGLTVHL